MLSINTNLSSLITQSSLKTSTLGLNQAIERMTTGFKINHAKDNAAGYSISTNMSTKISAYQVAEDNATMGLNMVTTASSTLATMENSLSRARALCIQAQNGTYGSQSINAIKSELNAIVDELIRTKESTEFNGINLFGKEGMPVANPETGFIADVVVQNPEITVSDPTKLLEAIENNTIIGISNAETLAELANIVNNDLHHCEGKTIVLTNDIDLSAYSNWTPIGWYDSADEEHHVFKGDFNGNGHTISNLTITGTSHDGVGLFGYSSGSNISNLGLNNVSITSSHNATASILGCGRIETSLINCFANVYTTGLKSLGGMVGNLSGDISYCYSTGKIVSSASYTGGLVGILSGDMNFCFSEADVESTNACVGGLIGCTEFQCTIKNISNSYATGNVKTINSDGNGGLIGAAYAGIINISDCYSTANVEGNNFVGGLLGLIYKSGDYCHVNISNSYSIGNVNGSSHTGSFVGINWTGCELNIKNSYSTGTVTGSSGNFVGTNDGTGEIDSLSGKIDSDTLNLLISEGKLPSTGNEVTGANTTLQIGINGDDNSLIGIDFGLTSSQISALKNNPTSSYSLAIIDSMLSKISEKQVQLGATENRLMSAMEEISINYENLVSSRSTIRDADIAEESSEYIRMQILQQASATLMATANQSPSIALQLI